MTLREDLEKALKAVIRGNADFADDETFDGASVAAFYFLRDHGPALLDALVDAERYHAVYGAYQAHLSAGQACTVCHGSGYGPDGKKCSISHQNFIASARAT